MNYRVIITEGAFADIEKFLNYLEFDQGSPLAAVRWWRKTLVELHDNYALACYAECDATSKSMLEANSSYGQKPPKPTRQGQLLITQERLAKSFGRLSRLLVTHVKPRNAESINATELGSGIGSLNFATNASQPPAFGPPRLPKVQPEM